MMEWLLVILLGGAVGLDATSFPQAMYSRPFVAGALAGMLMGRPVEGALIGAVLEVFSLSVLPFGATGYPEGGTAAVAATAAYAAAAAEPDASLAFISVTLALPVSHVSGYSVRLLRRRNGRAIGHLDGVDALAPAVVESTHRRAIAFDFLRGAVLSAAGVLLILAVLELALRVGWQLPVAALGVLTVAVIMMFAGTLAVFGTLREQLAPFLLGAGIALVGVWAL